MLITFDQQVIGAIGKNTENVVQTNENRFQKVN